MNKRPKISPTSILGFALAFGGLALPAAALAAPEISINDGMPFVPVVKPNAVNLTLDIVPNDWQGQQAEVFVWGSRTAGGNFEQVFLTQNGWQTYEDMEQIQPLQTMTVDHVDNLGWQLFSDTANVPYDDLQFMYCLDNTMDGKLTFATSSCSRAVIKFDGVGVVTSRTAKGALSAASVKTADGMVIGLAQTRKKASRKSSVSFDVPVASQYGLLIVQAVDGTRNPKLKGVDVRLVSQESGPMARILKGKTSTQGFKPQILQPFPPDAEIEGSMAQIRREMGIANPKSAEEILAKLSDMESAIQQVSPETWDQLNQLLLRSQQSSMLAFNTPMPVNGKPGTVPLFAILNPGSGSYRVQVIAKKGAKRFGVLATYIPLPLMSQWDAYTTPLERSDFRRRSLLRAERLLNQQLAGTQAAPRQAEAQPDAPRANAAGDIPAPCQELMDSWGVKMTTSVITAAGTGALGKVIGGIVGAKLGTSAAEKIGENAGTLLGLFGDASEWIDLTKTAVRFQIAQSLPLLDRVLVNPQKTTICVGESTDVLVGYFNRCDGPLFGLNLGGSNSNVRVTPPQVGDLSYQGVAWGVGDLWGTGDRYRFYGATEGVANISFAAPTADGPVTAQAQITVQRCASPKVTF
jgi:hypothetical protein